MSFSFTEKEQERAVLASLFGVTLEYTGQADLATIITIATAYGIQLLVVIYMVLNRDYPPIRAKGVLTMVCMYICGISWFIGGLGTHELIHLSNKFWSNCKLNLIWLRPVIGEAFIFNLLFLRCIQLLFQYQLHRPFQGIWKYLLLVISFMIPAACAIVITLMWKRETVSFVEVLKICNATDGFKAVSTALNWAALGTLIAGCLLIHRTICVFGENRELEIACIAFIAALLYHTIVFYKYPYYPSQIKWRVSVMFVEQSAIFIAWWAIMYTPLYQCLVHRDEYLLEWSKTTSTISPLASEVSPEEEFRPAARIHDHPPIFSQDRFGHG